MTIINMLTERHAARRSGGRLKVAVLGRSSFAAQVYLGELGQPSAGVDLVGIVDPWPSRVDPGASVPVYDSLDGLAAAHAVDVLFVADWRTSPAEAVAFALAHGWHVVCNELFGVDRAQEDALMRQATDAGVSLVAGVWPAWFGRARRARTFAFRSATPEPLVEVVWNRPAAPGAACAGLDTVLPSLQELLPRLLAVGVAHVADPTPLRMLAVRRDGPVPSVRVTVDFVHEALVSVVVRHDHELLSDRAWVEEGGEHTPLVDRLRRQQRTQLSVGLQVPYLGGLVRRHPVDPLIARVVRAVPAALAADDWIDLPATQS